MPGDSGGLPHFVGTNLDVAKANIGTLTVAGSQVNGTAYVLAPPPNGSDDTTALAALAGITNTHIQLQPGTYKTSAPIAPASGVVVQGASRKQTIIQALASWTAGATNSGIFNFTSAATLYSGNGFSDLQFDLTLATYAANHICAIHQDGTGSQVQHFQASNLWFELTANANSFGLEFEGLGGLGTGGTSFDITVQNVYAHNGSGSVLLYLNSTNAASIAHSIFVQNIVNLVDINGVSDDRVLIAGNAPSGGGNPEVRDVAVRGVYTTIASNVTSGRINGVKVDSGSTGNAYVHNVSIRDVYHRYYGAGGLSGCNPVTFLIGTTSFIQDVFVDNIYGISSGAIILRLGRFEADPSLTITNVHMKGCTDIFNLEVYCRTTAVGDESVVIRNASLHNANGVSGNTPTGILLTSGAAGQGGSGLVVIDACELENLSVGVTNNLNESLGVQATAWSNIYVSKTNLSTVTTPANLINTWTYENFNAQQIQSSGNVAMQAATGSQFQLGIGGAANQMILSGGASAYTSLAGELRLAALGGNGHIVDSASGTPATSALGANVSSVTFTGNDTRGTIAIVMSGALAANTRIATCTFAVTYGATAPTVLLVNETAGVGLTIVDFYRSAFSTGVSFDIAADQALAAGTYTVAYIAIG